MRYGIRHDDMMRTMRTNMDVQSVEIPERIETERLYLRPYDVGDGALDFAAGTRNREHLSVFEFGNVLNQLTSETHAETVVRELRANWNSRTNFFLGIFERATDEWTGQVYVGPTNWELPEFTIGYVAKVNYEGRGYISEAMRGVLQMLFMDMGAHRVCSDCNERNNRSRRLLERCGFKREGHLRENRRSPDGTLHGDYLYGRLRREYPQLL